MKGNYAFCPKSGAPLSKELHYDDEGRPRRCVESDENSAVRSPDGELTNGSLRSSKVAVFNHFRRRHQRHHGTDSRLYSKATLALRRLKRTANGREAWDMYVWYALAERLDRLGFDVRWMSAHVEPRCPRCAGRLKYERTAADELVARCGTDCTDDRSDRLAEIRETVVGLYGRAFEDDTSERPSVDDLEYL